MNSHVFSLSIFDDGAGAALYAGGDFTQAGGESARNIARWDGTEWSPLGSGVYGDVDALAVFQDDTGSALYAGGSFYLTEASPSRFIARWGSSCISTPCPPDVTNDNTINLADLNLVLANFGSTTAEGDTNDDGVVDLADLNAVLGAFGTDCP
jgi:hypothetical protein